MYIHYTIIYQYTNILNINYKNSLKIKKKHKKSNSETFRNVNVFTKFSNNYVFFDAISLI